MCSPQGPCSLSSSPSGVIITFWKHWTSCELVFHLSNFTFGLSQKLLAVFDPVRSIFSQFRVCRGLRRCWQLGGTKIFVHSNLSISSSCKMLRIKHPSRFTSTSPVPFHYSGNSWEKVALVLKQGTWFHIGGSFLLITLLQHGNDCIFVDKCVFSQGALAEICIASAWQFCDSWCSYSCLFNDRNSH